MSILLFDTAVGSFNLGDQIIMDSVRRVVNDLFKNEFVVDVPTHQWIHPLDLPPLRKNRLAIVGGTNLLKNDNFLRNQWKIGLMDMLVLNNKAVLLGVGWWQYQTEPVSFYSRLLYQSVLSKQYIHSVRDAYTLEKLRSIGIDNVINTGCPTTWDLTEIHCAKIPREKQKRVVATVTDYLRDPERDRLMLETLKNEYEDVHVWMQGSQDENYVRQLCDGLHIIPPKLQAFDEFLDTQACDYVGTRLHAGIRALQKKRRALIIGIDNRALEIQKDIGLNVLPRTEIVDLPTKINKTEATQLHIAQDQINQWKKQFTPSTPR